MPSIRDLVLHARDRLAAAGVEPNEAAMDAELLAREVLGWDLARFLAYDTDPPPATFPDAFASLVVRRAGREPVSEILGRREFWGLEFEVTRDVLTPRPESEIIVEEAIARIRAAQPASGSAPAGAAAPRMPPLRFADVGTGTGCLAVCLARAFEQSTTIATDTSAPAIEIARRNATRHGVLDRIDFRLTSLLDGVEPSLDLVVSNPPYVRTGDLATLPPEVRDFEPRDALDGGADGLDVMRGLARAAERAVRAGGWLIAEFGFGQEAGVREAVTDAGLELVDVRLDLQGIPRTVVARKPAGG